MTVKGKLEVHLLHIVMPEGVPMTGKEQQALIDDSTFRQRLDAAVRAIEHTPLLLPDEWQAASDWVCEGKQ